MRGVLSRINDYAFNAKRIVSLDGTSDLCRSVLVVQCRWWCDIS